MELNEDKLKHIAKGAAFLASGGGGSYTISQKMIADILAQKHPVELISVSDVQKKLRGAVIADMGSPDAMFSHPEFSAPTAASDALEHWSRQHLDFVLPIEVGAINSLVPMTVAARKGIPIVDADGAGRAIPQLEMTTYNQSGIAISPAALATGTNTQGIATSSVILNVPNASALEALARPIIASSSFQEIAGLTCYPLTGEELKQAVISGTMTLAMQVGQAISQATTKGQSAIDVLLTLPQLQPCYLLGRGKLISNTVKTKGGFDCGRVILENSADGTQITLYYENESLIAYDHNHTPLAMAPDSICCITEKGQPLSNADLPLGTDIPNAPCIALIGLKSRKELRTTYVEQAFLNVLKQFDYHGDYIPIEKLHPKHG